MVDRHDLALARARVLLSDIAPEIPQAEIVPEARLTDDLELDLVSIWALAAGLEKLAKVEIPDAEIRAAATLGDLLAHALTDVPAGYVDDSATGVQTSNDAAATGSAHETSEGAEDDLESAMQDLVSLFK